MFNFGVKDIIDIFLFALLLYYVYRLMKESGTINIFYSAANSMSASASGGVTIAKQPSAAIRRPTASRRFPKVREF